MAPRVAPARPGGPSRAAGQEGQESPRGQCEQARPRGRARQAQRQARRSQPGSPTAARRTLASQSRRSGDWGLASGNAEYRKGGRSVPGPS